MISAADVVASAPDESDEGVAVVGTRLLFCSPIGWRCREWPCERLMFWTDKILFHKRHT